MRVQVEQPSGSFANYKNGTRFRVDDGGSLEVRTSEGFVVSVYAPNHWASVHMLEDWDETKEEEA